MYLPPDVPVDLIEQLRVGRDVARWMLFDGFVSPCPVWVDPMLAPDEIRALCKATLMAGAPSYSGRIVL